MHKFNLDGSSWQASPECLERMAKRDPATKPDFTVTAVRLKRAFVGTLGSHGFVLSWETESAGFGELTVCHDPDDTLRCDTEGMSWRFVREVFAKFVDTLAEQASQRHEPERED